MKISFSIIIPFICLFLLSACGKEEEKQVIPWHQVNFTINLNNQDVKLKTPGNTMSYTSRRLETDYIGFSGLLVVCGYDGTLFAYDLCCPYEAIQAVKVTPLTDGTAKCSKCGSIYNIMDGFGNAKSGPSKTHLQRYIVRKDLSLEGVFRITR